MKLKELLAGLDILEATADLEMNIDTVTYDSRKVTPGSLFVAITGFATDGNLYIPMALEKGADRDGQETGDGCALCACAFRPAGAGNDRRKFLWSPR